MVILIAAASVLINLSQRKSLNKERLLQKIRNELQTHVAKLRENADAMKINETAMKEITKRAGNKAEKGSDPWEIELFRQNNYILQCKNDVLEKKVQAYTNILQEKELKLASYDKLRKRNEELIRRERYLLMQLEKHDEILTKLRNSTKAVQPEEWPEIINNINQLNNNFTQRLKQQMPFLSESDIQCCCLIKLRLPTATIASLAAISPTSVTKRKQRIRSRISQQANGLLEKTESLDDLIWRF
jgi:hypothetical protein